MVLIRQGVSTFSYDSCSPSPLRRDRAYNLHTPEPAQTCAVFGEISSIFQEQRRSYDSDEDVQTAYGMD